MIGVPVRVHDMTGDDIGLTHVPWPVEVGDLVALEAGEFRVVDVVIVEPGFPIAAFAKCAPAHLRLVTG